MFIILVFISQTESEKSEKNLITRTSKVMEIFPILWYEGIL